MNDHVPVGLYGNGFKSGSMRLGKDAMVFTKNGESKSELTAARPQPLQLLATCGVLFNSLISNSQSEA